MILDSLKIDCLMWWFVSVWLRLDCCQTNILKIVTLSFRINIISRLNSTDIFSASQTTNPHHVLLTHLTLFLQTFSSISFWPFPILHFPHSFLLPCLRPTLDLFLHSTPPRCFFPHFFIPCCLVQYIIHPSSLFKTKPCPYFSALIVVSSMALFHYLSPPGSFFGGGGGSGVPTAPSGRNGEAAHFWWHQRARWRNRGNLFANMGPPWRRHPATPPSFAAGSHSTATAAASG